MLVLALDTALSAAQSAVVRDGQVLAARTLPMERGHQEALAPLVAETMREAGVAFSELDRLAVTVGPGSFTGVRVGVAFAKGLSVALSRPCLGVGTLEALAAGEGAGFVVAAIDGRRGRLYLQAFADGAPVMAPDSLAEEEVTARLAELYSGGPAVLTGPEAAALEGIIPATVEPRAYPDIAAVALLAERAPEPTAPPRPLYLRAPDARTIAERMADR